MLVLHLGEVSAHVLVVILAVFLVLIHLGTKMKPYSEDIDEGLFVCCKQYASNFF